MSEIQKGRPTIYGEVQSPRRRTGRPGVHTYGAESQKRYAGRMTEHYGSAQMEDAGRPALGNRARTEQAPRRRTSVSAPEAYTAPFDRPAHGWENMPEQELRRTDFASDRKLRALWSVFGILAVLLVAAIIYEIVLGNGLKETGGQRMAGQAGTQTTGQTTAQTNAASSTSAADAALPTQTTGQTTAQTNAASSTPAADAALPTQTTAQTSAAVTPDAGTTDADAGSDSAAADDSTDEVTNADADATVDDEIPTIPLEGDGAQAEEANGAE